MTDDLVLAGLIFILVQEVDRTGKCDLVDVFFDLFLVHTDTVIDHADRFLGRVDDDGYLECLVVAEFRLAHHGELLQFGDRVTAVGDELTDEDVMVGIEPFLDDREDVFAADGKVSLLGFRCFCHIYYTSEEHWIHML